MMNRRKILKLLGRFPEKCDLNIKTHETIKKEEYTLKKIAYNVEPDERINALLLIPKDCEKDTPGILALHQHGLQYNLGKSEPAGINGDKMYAYGLELCLRGYVVLCPDNLCFEERQSDELEGMLFERFTFMKYLVEGSTLQAKYISDLLCGLKVLKSNSEVDSNNIGVIGHSLGGQESIWLMGYDKSIKCGVSSGGFSKMKEVFDRKINHSFSTYIPKFLEEGDMEDVVSLIAPRPFLVIAGEKDPIFPISGVKKIMRDVMKKSDNFDRMYFDGGHIFPEDMRVKAYDWLDSHLR